jgi:hypothetical protein
MAYIDHPVHDRLFFAERRLNDLRALKQGDMGGAPHRDRQILLQEFFYHLCGAIEVLAQVVNEVKKLGLDEWLVWPRSVANKLDERPDDPLISSTLKMLKPQTQGRRGKVIVPLPLPSDPYSEEGSHFRIVVFRNVASHIRNYPLNLYVFAGSPDAPYVCLYLDPRFLQGQRTPSKREAFEELALFLELVTSKCNSVLRELGIPTP